MPSNNIKGVQRFAVQDQGGGKLWFQLLSHWSNFTHNFTDEERKSFEDKYETELLSLMNAIDGGLLKAFGNDPNFKILLDTLRSSIYYAVEDK
tara:strand:+ start:172 stop:450 length:279 start_codon:yes stop_codon:yes gene_type:complete